MSRFTHNGVEYEEPLPGTTILPGDGFIANNEFISYTSGSFMLIRTPVKGTIEARPVTKDSTASPSVRLSCRDFITDDIRGLDLSDPLDQNIAVALLERFVAKVASNAK